ncbi:MAG: DEAD/DEAH box helicase [Thermoanaerobaculia bacterium]|nr:DEAD/DEAH box helicase [Thermoanaerobaculia bacterium]
MAVEWTRNRLSRYPGVLLADEVGLGKSWVAAELARERFEAGDQIELIIPASLVSMWRDVEKLFRVESTILTHDVIRRSRELPEKPSFIIVDEAHRFRNPRTKGWRRLAKRLIGARALFLTATPIWNDPDDLLALLRLLVPDDALRHAGVASIEVGLMADRGRTRIVDQLVLRRRQEIFEPSLSLGKVERRLVEYPVPMSWHELESLIRDLRFPHCLGFSRPILSILMARRLHSSPEALRATLEHQRNFCRAGLDLLRKGFYLNRRDFTRFLISGEGIQELLFPELFLESEDQPDASDLSSEIETIEAILDAISTLDDPKRECLASLLSTDSRPCLVFVSAVETAKVLWGDLSGAVSCAVATGSVCRSASGHRSVGEITREFQSGRIDLLIATDLGGEGLNLQRADRVIHYDLPWSPMRLEQRNGRARRLGRAGRPLEVVTFVPEGGESPAWSVLEKKRSVTRRFWDMTAESPVELPCFERLPSRITANDPRVRLWQELPASEERLALLQRFRAGTEIELFEIEARESLDVIRTDSFA